MPRPDPYAQERALARIQLQQFRAVTEAKRGSDGYTPKKGIDYFTPSEIAQFIDTIQKHIRVPQDGAPGKDAVVDYELILEYVIAEADKAAAKAVAALPKPKDGKDGKDAEVDMAALVSAVLKKLPKVDAKTKTVDYLGIKQYIDKQFEAFQKEPNVIQSFTGGGATSIRQLRDVDLTGVPQDSKGNYVLTPGGGSGHTIQDEGISLTSRTKLNFVGSAVTVTDDAVNSATVVTITGTGGGGSLSFEILSGTANGVNTVFTATTAPTYIVADGLVLFENEGYTLSGLTVTFDVAPSRAPRAAIASGSISIETLTGTANGVNVNFTVTATPKCIVADGVTLFDGDGYTLTGLNVAFDVAPSRTPRAII